MDRVVAERLREAMKARGWNGKQLAEAADVSESAVSRHISDDPKKWRAPRIDVVNRYADALGVPIGHLLGADTDIDALARIPTRAAAENISRRLRPEAQVAIDDFNWDNVAPDEELAILTILASFSEALPEDVDLPAESWTSKIVRLLKEMGRLT